MSNSTIDPRARKGLVPLQIRLDPKGLDLAIRNSNHPGLPWRTTSGDLASDEVVQHWYPLIEVSPEDRARLAYALECTVQSNAPLATAEPGDFDRLIKFFGSER